MPKFAQARKAANTVLKENFITKPPVPVVQLAKNYGYQVKGVDLSSDVAGFVDPQKNIIYVNDSDSDTRKAFTIAHELGHIKLHANLLEKNPNLGIFYRQPLGKKNDNDEEQEANHFAACLLVPQPMLEKTINRYQTIVNNDGNGILGSLFGVSPEVIGFRLHDLGIEIDNGQ